MTSFQTEGTLVITSVEGAQSELEDSFSTTFSASSAASAGGRNRVGQNVIDVLERNVDLDRTRNDLLRDLVDAQEGSNFQRAKSGGALGLAAGGIGVVASLLAGLGSSLSLGSIDISPGDVVGTAASVVASDVVASGASVAASDIISTATGVSAADVIDTGATVAAGALVASGAAVPASALVAAAASIKASDIISSPLKLNVADVIAGAASIAVSDVIGDGVTLNVSDVVASAFPLGAAAVLGSAFPLATSALIGSGFPIAPSDLVEDTGGSGSGSGSSSPGLREIIVGGLLGAGGGLASGAASGGGSGGGSVIPSIGGGSVGGVGAPPIVAPQLIENADDLIGGGLIPRRSDVTTDNAGPATVTVQNDVRLESRSGTGGQSVPQQERENIIQEAVRRTENTLRNAFGGR